MRSWFVDDYVHLLWVSVRENIEAQQQTNSYAININSRCQRITPPFSRTDRSCYTVNRQQGKRKQSISIVFFSFQRHETKIHSDGSSFAWEKHTETNSINTWEKLFTSAIYKVRNSRNPIKKFTTNCKRLLFILKIKQQNSNDLQSLSLIIETVQIALFPISFDVDFLKTITYSRNRNACIWSLSIEMLENKIVSIFYWNGLCLKNSCALVHPNEKRIEVITVSRFCW